MRLVAQPSAQFLHQARLADSRLAGQQHHLAFAFFGLLPAAQQERDLLLAADQWGETRGVPCLETALGPPFSSDPPDCERLGEALKSPGSEVIQLEQGADKLSRDLADDHRSRLGEGLQAGG